uniref:Uncharacterized protein n=1 Tax=Anguilla anguilla TaxID=7936 RepID=A0A0E9XN36_ANGAN
MILTTNHFHFSHQGINTEIKLTSTQAKWHCKLQIMCKSWSSPHDSG